MLNIFKISLVLIAILVGSSILLADSNQIGNAGIGDSTGISVKIIKVVETSLVTDWREFYTVNTRGPVGGTVYIYVRVDKGELVTSVDTPVVKLYENPYGRNQTNATLLPMDNPHMAYRSEGITNTGVKFYTDVYRYSWNSSGIYDANYVFKCDDVNYVYKTGPKSTFYVSKTYKSAAVITHIKNHTTAIDENITDRLSSLKVIVCTPNNTNATKDYKLYEGNTFLIDSSKLKDTYKASNPGNPHSSNWNPLTQQFDMGINIELETGDALGGTQKNVTHGGKSFYGMQLSNNTLNKQFSSVSGQSLHDISTDDRYFVAVRKRKVKDESWWVDTVAFTSDQPTIYGGFVNRINVNTTTYDGNPTQIIIDDAELKKALKIINSGNNWTTEQLINMYTYITAHEVFHAISTIGPHCKDDVDVFCLNRPGYSTWFKDNHYGRNAWVCGSMYTHMKDIYTNLRIYE